MTRVPDFTTLEFAQAKPQARAGTVAPWLTPEGIPVKPAYGPDDLAGHRPA